MDPELMKQMQAGGGGMPTQESQKAQQQKQEQAMEQRGQMLSAVMSSEARDRLHRVSLVKPEKAQQMENAILQMAQRGQITEKLSDERLVQMLQGGPTASGKTSSVTYKRRNLDDDDEW